MGVGLSQRISLRIINAYRLQSVLNYALPLHIDSSPVRNMPLDLRLTIHKNLVFGQ